jgi:hypothetical protein
VRPNIEKFLGFGKGVLKENLKIRKNSPFFHGIWEK